jgi:predicted nucleic acid-binding protein
MLDTCFLIDLHREYSGKAPQGAVDFLQRHSEQSFSISAITAVEFLEGFRDERRGIALLKPFRILPFEDATSVYAARIRRNLRKKGTPIGDMDILIAATALHARLPLVTHNLVHFGRIPDLECQNYRV